MRKELSQTRNAKVISSSHDSLILKLNNSSTHFSFYQHKPFDSPPASHSPDLTSTTVQLFYSDFWFPSITFQLRNHRSLVGAVTVPCRSQHIWTLRRLPVGLCYLGQNRAAAIALPCSGGLNRQKLTKKTHIKKNATFVWWCFLMCLKFLSMCVLIFDYCMIETWGWRRKLIQERNCRKENFRNYVQSKLSKLSGEQQSAQVNFAKKLGRLGLSFFSSMIPWCRRHFNSNVLMLKFAAFRFSIFLCVRSLALKLFPQLLTWSNVSGRIRQIGRCTFTGSLHWVQPVHVQHLPKWFKNYWSIRQMWIFEQVQMGWCHTIGKLLVSENIRASHHVCHHDKMYR